MEGIDLWLSSGTITQLRKQLDLDLNLDHRDHEAMYAYSIGEMVRQLEDDGSLKTTS